MFDWFKKLPQAPNALTRADVPDILEKYGALMEKHPTAYMDETWLPVSKAQMRSVFKAAWKMAPDSTLRNHSLKRSGCLRAGRCSSSQPYTPPP
jgi:hypothetical protein